MKQILERLKSGKLAVNCQIEEDAKQFVELCHRNNIEWGVSDEECTYFIVYKEETHYYT